MQLDRHEIAALALTLGILCFAVVTAIMLVRTRRRLAATRGVGARRDHCRPTPRSTAPMRCCSPSRRSSSPGQPGDEPEIIGDPTLVAAAETPQRVLAFGTWLEPEQAQAMERSVDALRARGVASR